MENHIQFYEDKQISFTSAIELTFDCDENYGKNPPQHVSTGHMRSHFEGTTATESGKIAPATAVIILALSRLPISLLGTKYTRSHTRRVEFLFTRTIVSV